MPQALINVNGSPGSNADLPINTLVALTNSNTGGEVSYTWSIVDQPPGSPAVALSSPSSATPTFTPTREGSYLIRLVVNQGLDSETDHQVVCAVRHVRTRLRAPAAGETVELGARGWAGSMGELLAALDAWRADPDVLVAVIDPAEVALDLAVHKVFTPSGVTTILSGLPGASTLPKLALSRATSLGNHLGRPLYVLREVVNGGSLAPGALCLFKRSGPIYGVTHIPTAAAGNALYLGDAGQLSLAPGTTVRQIGLVAFTDGSTMTVLVDGSVGWSLQQFQQVALTGDLNLNASGATIQGVLKDSNGTGALRVGTKGNASLFVRTNNTDQWECTTAGVLRSTDGTNGRTIDRVADAASALEAVNKRTLEAKVARSFLTFGAGDTPAGANVTAYLWPGYLVDSATAFPELSVPVPLSGGTARARRLSVVVRTAPAGDALTFVLRVNGVNSALTCTVAAGATTGNGTASVVINDGDLVSIAVTSGAAGVSGAIDVRCTVGLEHTLAA